MQEPVCKADHCTQKDFHGATKLGKNLFKILTCIWGLSHPPVNSNFLSKNHHKTKLTKKCAHADIHSSTQTSPSVQLHSSLTQLMLSNVVNLNNDPFQVLGGSVTLQTAIIYQNSGHQHRSLPTQLSPQFNISKSCLQTFRDQRRWRKMRMHILFLQV